MQWEFQRSRMQSILNRWWSVSHKKKYFLYDGGYNKLHVLYIVDFNILNSNECIFVSSRIVQSEICYKLNIEIYKFIFMLLIYNFCREN